MDVHEILQFSDSEPEEHHDDGPYNLQRENKLMEELQGVEQNPSLGPITYADLRWLPHTTTGKGCTVPSEIAVIPWERLEDFVMGQEENQDYPTTFNRHVTKTNRPGSLAKPRATSPAQIIRYRCCYGPEDYSNVVVQDVQAVLDSTLQKRRQSCTTNTKRRRGRTSNPEYDVFQTTKKLTAKATRIGKKQSGRSIKKGCMCCFYAKQPYQNPTICLLIFRHPHHTDKDGNVVHGRTIAGFKDSLGPGLSDGMKQHLTNLLWLGLSPSQVMAQHKQFVKDIAQENGPVNRDTFVQAQDVRNLAKLRDEALWQKHQSDPRSVKMWVEENPDSVFCYKEHGLLDLNKTKQDDTPFTLGIQTPWQLQMLLKFGNSNAFSIDATFGTSETRYPLYTVMVFDEFRNGIPVAFFVISQCREKDLQHVLMELQKRAQEEQLSWAPASIIVDNAQAEINVLRTIWPSTAIYLCLWHVRKNWRENAVKKISTIAERGYILNALGNIMYGKGLGVDQNPEAWAQLQLDTLTAERPNATAFMKYMTKHWRPKAAMWCTGNKILPHAGQNTNAAIESYHGNLKSILRSSRERFGGRRLDWLIFHLVGDVITHYWYAVQCKLLGFVRNRSQERIVASAIVRAREIPDSVVRVYPNNEDVALVASCNHYPKVWTVHSPDSEWAQCDCSVGLQGMICKHTVKVFRVLHPTVSDGLLIREAGTRHGVDRTTPLSSCFIAGPSQSNLTPDTFPPVEDDTEAVDPVLEELKDNLPRTSKRKAAMTEDPKLMVSKVYCELLATAEEHPQLFDFLIADLKNAREKQKELLARGLAGVQHPAGRQVFQEIPGDNSLRRYRSFLEPKNRKVPRTRTK